MLSNQNAITCPVCGTLAQIDITLKYKGLVNICDEYKKEICVCQTCEHIFEANPFDEETLSKYYKQLSKYENISENQELPLENIKSAKRQVDFVEDAQLGTKSVLDIGASMGILLNTFKTRGYDVFGIEPSKNNKIFAKNRFDIDLYSGTLEEYVNEENKRVFDIVTMSHVLEHTADPIGFIKNAASLSDKYLFIEVPVMNVTMNTEAYGIFFYEHLGYFSNESLSYLMKECGFKPLRMNIEYNINGESPQFPTLVTLWEKGEGRVIENAFPVKVLLDQYMLESAELIQKAEDVISQIDSSKLAVYGTGSHTSKLLGMTSLAEKNIVKYYDSDWKKEGLSILGKPITRFDKKDIESGLVDTILISTFASEKVIKAFIEDQGLDVTIITLYM